MITLKSVNSIYKKYKTTKTTKQTRDMARKEFNLRINKMNER